MGRKIIKHKKGTFFVWVFSGLCFLFASCSGHKEADVRNTVTTPVPQTQATQSAGSTALPDTNALCVYVTVKDMSGQMLSIQNILRLAAVSKTGDDISADPMGVSLMKVCPETLKDYLVDVLLTESKNKRVYHGTFKITKDELQKNISKDVVVREETETLVIQGSATVNANTEVTYFASPAANVGTNSDLYNGVSSFFFYVSPKSAVSATQTSYDGLKLHVGDVSNLRITIWCEAWSDTKGLLGYGVRTVLVTDASFSTSAATNTANENDAASQKSLGSIDGTLILLDESWYGSKQCPYTDYTVEVLDMSLTATVSQDGTFRFESVPLGEHILIAKKQNKEKGRWDVNVTNVTTPFKIQIPVRC